MTDVRSIDLALSDRILTFVCAVASQPDVRTEVELNHDDNRWWPTSVVDWRMRMAVAGWSSRVSYTMIATYARVVNVADRLGWDKLVTLSDEEIAYVVRPLGLMEGRVRYLRSLAGFLDCLNEAGVDPRRMPADDLISMFAKSVAGASYKVAQCAVLYSRGYHCGVIPVDSGMVTKLAPCLGVELSPGPSAHDELRRLLEGCLDHQVIAYRKLVHTLSYDVTIPAGAAPSWWLHLVLIYFKRLYLNRTSDRLCPRRPSCARVVDCGCEPHGGRRV